MRQSLAQHSLIFIVLFYDPIEGITKSWDPPFIAPCAVLTTAMKLKTARLSSRVLFCSLSLMDSCVNFLVSPSLNYSALSLMSTSLVFLALPCSFCPSLLLCFYICHLSLSLILLLSNFSLCFSLPASLFFFLLPILRFYALVSPDAAKLIRTHPINSSPAYAETGRGVCACMSRNAEVGVCVCVHVCVSVCVCVCV